MASTNKTTNYDLSQFISTDKPAWLSDYNQDMSKIDTGIKNAADAATAAGGTASAASTAIGTLTNLTTTDKTNLVSAINEVNTNAATAQGTANTAVNNAATAQSTANSAINMWDINQFSEYSYSQTTNLTVTNGTLANYTGLKIMLAKNSDASLFKVYGELAINPTTAAGQTITIKISNSGLTPSTSYSILNPGILSTANRNIDDITNLTVNSNGDITITVKIADNSTHFVRLFPCLYINKDFGD